MGYEYTVENIKQAIYDLLKETKLDTKDIEGIGWICTVMRTLCEGKSGNGIVQL